MKNNIFILFVSFFSVAFSQQKMVKQVFLTSNEIEISALGLDTLTILTSESNQVEVSLFNENVNSEDLEISNSSERLKITFKQPFIPNEKGVFRKFITKRLHRSYAVVKIPKNKNITIFGRNIDIVSKSYRGNLQIFIDKGVVKLHQLQGNTEIHLFQGTIVASVKNTNINIKTTHGTILFDGEKHSSPFVKTVKNASKKFVVNSINANVSLHSL